MLPYSLRHREGSPQGNEEAIIWPINESFLYLKCFYCLNWVTSHIGCHSGKERSLCGFFLQVYQRQLAIYVNQDGGRKDKLKFNIRKMGGMNIVNHVTWLPWCKVGVCMYIYNLNFPYFICLHLKLRHCHNFFY